MGKCEKQEEKKKFSPMVIIIIVVVVAVLIAALVFQGYNDENRDSDTSSNTEAGINDDGTLLAEEDETAEFGQEDSEAEKATNALDENESGTVGENSGNSDSHDSTSSQGTDDIDTSGTSKNEATAISFPYTSDRDELKLIAVYNYGGYYIEDGSEDEIDSVAVLEVTNISDQIIEYATVTLTADGEELHFEISLLPAGETALVMEADRQSCSETASFDYEGSEIANLSSFDLCEDQVSISTDSGAVTVKNISGDDISELRLFYKNQLDTGEYVGGIAYTVKLENLVAGASQTVYPSHLDPEYGVIMMARIY